MASEAQDVAPGRVSSESEREHASATNRNYRLAVIGGDGIGPEVTSEALKALQAASDRYGFSVSTTEYDLGGRRYVKTGEILPDGVIDELRTHDAILLGAVGTPEVEPGVIERGLLLKLRFVLELSVNLRPIKLYPGVRSPITDLTTERCDILVVRENVEGLYVGAGGLLYPGTDHELATQESLNTRYGVERVVRYALERARERDGRLTLCHKTNVLTYAGALWQRVLNEVAAEYPDVHTDYVNVDAMCVYLVTQPERFDTVVTDNMFGDIITDLGAAIQGGLGLAASANLNVGGGIGMFEPVHGSAPDIAGTGSANPIAAVLSAALCIEHLGEHDAALALEHAAVAVLPELPTLGEGGSSYSTRDIGDRIAAGIAAS